MCSVPFLHGERSLSCLVLVEPDRLQAVLKVRSVLKVLTFLHGDRKDTLEQMLQTPGVAPTPPHSLSHPHTHCLSPTHPHNTTHQSLPNHGPRTAHGPTQGSLCASSTLTTTGPRTPRRARPGSTTGARLRRGSWRRLLGAAAVSCAELAVDSTRSSLSIST